MYVYRLKVETKIYQAINKYNYWSVSKFDLSIYFYLSMYYTSSLSVVKAGKINRTI